MIELDLRSIMLMSTLMGSAMSVVLYSAHRSFPPEIKGLRDWSLGLVMLVCGSLLYSVSDRLPDALALMGTTAMLLWGIGLSLIGMQKFYGRAPCWRCFHLLWTGGLLGMAALLLANASFAARLALFSFLVFPVHAGQLAMVARHGERHVSTYLFGALMLGQALEVLARGVVALTHGAGEELTRTTPFHTLALAAANVMALLLTVCFMMIATRRLQIILEQRSTLDPLTGVLNRRGFADIYAKEASHRRRDRRPMTLLSIDLDCFKSINDHFGHSVGDRVLTQVAHAIGRSLREVDYVARFGGEEFVVLLPETGLERAQLVAARIHASVQERGDHSLPPCTISIGVACQVSPEEPFDRLLQRADASLYRAKENGRNRTEVADHLAPPQQRQHP